MLEAWNNDDIVQEHNKKKHGIKVHVKHGKTLLLSISIWPIDQWQSTGQDATRYNMILRLKKSGNAKHNMMMLILEAHNNKHGNSSKYANDMDM